MSSPTSTCTVGDSLDAMPAMPAGDAHGDCIVLNEAGVIMGRTRAKQIAAAAPGATVDDVMEIGPTTVRPDERLDAVVERMQRRRVTSLVVARLDGTFVGILDRAHAETVLGIDGSAIEQE